MAADQGNPQDKLPTQDTAKGRSLLEKSSERLRRLLGLGENLAADPGEVYVKGQEREQLGGAGKTGQDTLPPLADSDRDVSAPPFGAPNSGRPTTEGLAGLAGVGPGPSRAATRTGAPVPSAGTFPSGLGGSRSAVNDPAITFGVRQASQGDLKGSLASAQPLTGEGDDKGAVVEDTRLQVSGTLHTKGGYHSQVIAETVSGRYGDLTVGSDGHWTYHLRPSQENDPFSIQHLNNGESQRDNFVARLTDASGQIIQVPIIITVHGSDDRAVISGVDSGTLMEDQGPQVSSGLLQVTDIDHGDQASFVAQSVAGRYGSFSLQSDGHWSYSVDPQKIQVLAQGQQVVETFLLHTTNAQGESVLASVSITVTGTDDKSVLPILSLTATEDGGLVTGRLMATDVDATALHYEPVPGLAPVAGVSIDADGTVHVDPGQPQFQSLAAGEHLDLQIPVQVVDERGVAVQSLLAVRIDGSNDAPTVTVQPPLPVDEGSGVQTVQVLARDADRSDQLAYGLPAGLGLPPGVNLNAVTGLITIDTNHPAYNSLAAGEIRTLVLPVVVSDGHGGSSTTQVSLELHGSNDAPALAAIGQRTATEGDAPIIGLLSGSDPDPSDKLSYGLANGTTAPAGFSIQQDGHWSFDPRDPAYNNLRTGDHQQVVVALQVNDGHGGSSQQLLTIGLTGTNDAAVISGTSRGSVREDQTLQASGVLSITDPDAGEGHFQAGDQIGSYGTLHLQIDGSWSYDLDNSKVQSLNNGDQTTEQFTVLSADGTPQQLHIQINGTDDAAVISGVRSGSLTEDRGPQGASGVLTVTDIDHGDGSSFVPQAVNGSYGTFSLQADGHWNYTADPLRIQVLKDGQQVVETFPLHTTNAQGESVSGSVAITLSGSDDKSVFPAVSFTATEDDGIVSGRLIATDLDGTALHYEPVPGSPAVGGISIAPDGTVRIDPAQRDFQSLAAGEHRDLQIPVQVVDERGVAVQSLLVVRIDGRNDAPTVTVQPPRPIQEGSGVNSVQVLARDVDTSDQLAYTSPVGRPLPAGVSLDPATGLVSIDTNHPAYNSLAEGQVRSVVVPVVVSDGHGGSTTTQVSLELHGSNDGPTLASIGQRTATEGDAPINGQLSATDPDSTDSLSFGVAVGVPLLPGFAIQSDGHWSFDPQNPAYNSLRAGDHQQVVVSLQVSDGHGGTSRQSLSIDLVGSNNRPLIAGTSSGSVKEDQSLHAAGVLSITDPDAGEGHFQAGDQIGSYGTLHLQIDGSWSYDLDNSKVQSLNNGDQTTEQFTVLSADGTPQQLHIQINGTDDAAVISGVRSGSLTEDRGPQGASGVLTVTDIDHGDGSSFVPQAVNGSYGTFSLQADGHWNYNADPLRIQVLKDGQQVVETFPVSTTNASGESVQASVSVAIVGTDDKPVFPPVSLTATEDGGIVTARLLATDVDATSLTYAPTPGALAVAGVSIDPDGTVHVDPSQPQFQNLAAGEHRDLRIPVQVSDERGVTVSSLLTVRVAGSNDAPTVTVHPPVPADEGSGVHSTQVLATDIDSSDKLSYGLPVGVSLPAGVTLDPATGQVAIDASNPAYNHLAEGQLQLVVVPIVVFDGHGGSSSTQVSFELRGTNDAPTLAAIGQRTATEGDAPINGVLSATDPDSTETLSYSLPSGISAPAGFTIQSDGHWAFDPKDPAYDQLRSGEQQQLVVPLQVADGHGSTSQQILTIALTGTNDRAVIAGTSSGSVKEDQTVQAAGVLSVTDPDAGEARFQPAVLNGLYGQLHMAADGSWSYTLDNTNPRVQALPAGGSLSDQLVVQSADGIAHQISVTVAGTDDAAQVSGSHSGQVTEDLLTSASGQLTVSDTDQGETPGFQAETLQGIYGQLGIDASGRWTYKLDPATSQELQGGVKARESFSVLASDGKGHQVSQQILVDVTGTNDAARISGTASGRVTEDRLTSASGKLDVVDVDRGEAHFQAGDQSGVYGTLHLGADGSWSYALDNASAKVQALPAGSTATETFTVRSADGTTHQVTLQVGGSNDAAVITGSSSGRVSEDATLQASGRLQIADVDQGESRLDPSDLGDKAGTYGTLHVNADGSWSYQLNNSARVVQDLQAGDTRQDSFTIHSGDGTSHQLQLTVVGASDAPVLTAGQLSGGREDNSLVMSSADILKALQATDPDGDPLSLASVSYSGGDATLVDNHNGTWTLTPHANWSGNLSFQVGVSDGHDVTTGTLTVPIAAVADTATMTVAPSLSSTFEDPTLGSQAYHFADPLQWGWHTDNVSGLVEQGKGETYGDPDHTNTGLIELEGQAGEKDNLYRVLDTQPGAAYHFSLDVSGRSGISSDSAAVEVLWEGKVIDTIRPAANTFGLVHHAYDLTAHTEHPRIEFRALTHDGSGPIVDNPHFEFRGFNGTEDTELPIKLSVETVDKDGSETITTGIKGLPPGFAITDGTTGHRLTSTAATQTLDMQGWDLQHLKVVPVANFNGRVDAVLIATTTESSNHDQAVTQIPVPLNFAGVNDPPTVGIGTSGALSEDSSETRTDQITASDSDGDSTSLDTSWLTANHWSTSDSGRTYTKAGTYGTATLTVASNQVSYQLNNTPGGPTDQLAAGQNGRDAFEVQISDGHGGSVSGMAIFNVNGTNDAPTVTAGVASATLIEGRSDTATSVLTILDKDSTDSSPTVDTAWLSNHGWTTADAGQTYTKSGTYGDATLTVMTNTVSYHLNNTPGGATDLLRAGAAAQDQFQVQVVDIHGATATTQVGFNLSGTNDAPIATAQTRGLQEDSNYHFQVADFGYQDIEGESLHHIAITSLPAGTSGKLTLDGHDVTVNQQIAAADLSRLVFEPAANFNGDSHFHFKASDGTSDSLEATATLRVAGVNDPPQFIGSGMFSSLPISAAYEFSSLASGRIDDLSTHANHAIPGSGVTLTTGHDGTANAAIHFDGSTEARVQIPDIKFGQGITLSSWVKYDNLNDFWSRIFDVGNGQGKDNIVLSHVDRGGTLELGFFDASGTYHSLRADNAVQQGTWTHIVATITHDGKMALYKDGALIGSTDAGVALPALQRTSNFLGQSNWGRDAHLTGAMDNFAIFDRDITADQARLLYQAGNLKDLLNKYDSISGSSFHAYSQENHPFVITRDEILRQVTDVDHDTLSLQSITCSGSNARVIDNHDGTYTVTPNSGYRGAVSLTVQVSDGHATVDGTITVDFTRTGLPNHAPVLQVQSKTVTEDSGVLTSQMIATDPDRGETQTFSIGTPVGGLSFHADGSYSFDSSHADYQGLKAGETRTLTIPVTVTDSSGATSRQNLTITVTGTDDIPTVTADTAAHSVTLADTREDTPHTYSSADLLALVGAKDVDSSTLSIKDIHVDASYGTFHASGTNWVFTPAANVSSPTSRPIPITLTIKDEQGATTTAYAQTSVSPITDRATVGLTVSVVHDVMEFGTIAKPAANNNSHVYASVGGGALTQATFEVISVGDPKHPGDPTAGTGPVILNLATSNTNNLVSFWRPANLSIAFNGTDYHTDTSPATGFSEGIDMTKGTHRVTTTWDSASGTLRIYDNGVLHNTFSGVLKGQSLNVTTSGFLTLGQKMNDYHGQGRFRDNEQYNGTIFSASFGTKSLSADDVRTGPMANLPSGKSQLQANFQSRNGAVANEVAGATNTSSSFQASFISHRAELIDVSAMPPSVGASLQLKLNVAAPSDTDDTISRQFLRGLPRGTILSDDSNHHLTVGDGGLVNLTTDAHDWNIHGSLTAQLPTGYNTNLALQVVVETKGPDGTLALESTNSVVVFDPNGNKNPMAAATEADLPQAPPPPPPTPDASDDPLVYGQQHEYAGSTQVLAEHDPSAIHQNTLDLRSSEHSEHAFASAGGLDGAMQAGMDSLAKLPSAEVANGLDVNHDAIALTDSDGATGQLTSAEQIDHQLINAEPESPDHRLGLVGTDDSNQSQVEGMSASALDAAIKSMVSLPGQVTDVSNPSGLDPHLGSDELGHAIASTPDASLLSSELLTEAADQLSHAASNPDHGSNGSELHPGQIPDLDQIPLSVGSDPLMTDHLDNGLPLAEPNTEITLPNHEQRPDDATDHLIHLS